MKILKYIFFVVFLAFAATQIVSAQNTKAEKEAKKAAEIKQLIDNKDFVFQAVYMYPLGGGQRYLNTYYDLKVGKDTVESFLPYFGVAYSGAGYNSNEDNGIKFTSKKFSYQDTPRKKDGWNINIRPEDTRSINRLTLTVASNGNADLTVISNNRQSIRFSGYIKEKPKTKK
jgi:hypothetical protein